MVLTVTYILAGVALVWISAQRLERYSLVFASKFGISPFLIGSIVIAFGTSAPEGLTSLFATLENRGTMVIGNVIGSNVANIGLVFLPLEYRPITMLKKFSCHFSSLW